MQGCVKLKQLVSMMYEGVKAGKTRDGDCTHLFDGIGLKREGKARVRTGCQGGDVTPSLWHTQYQNGLDKIC